MKIVTTLICSLFCAISVFAQSPSEVDAAKVYFWSGGSSRCSVMAGNGAPSGGNNCDRYVDYSTGIWYTKLSGVWTTLTDSSGKIPAISSTYFTSLSGANLTSLNASNISSGNLAYARMPSGSGTWSASPTIAGTTTIGGNLLPDTADSRDVGSAALPWRQGYLSQMNAVLFAKSTQTLYGGWLAVSKNAGTFAVAVASADTTIDFGQTMVLNQFILVRAADTGGTISEEYIKVGTNVSGTVYNVTRNLSGAGAKNWAIGTPYQVRGVAGDGWLELDAFDTPRMSIWTQGSAYNNSIEDVRIGYLTGMPNSSSGLGLYAGDATNYLRWDGSALTLHSSGAVIDSSGITVSGGNALYDTSGSYKFSRATASGYGAPGDQLGVWVRSINAGFQDDTLTVDNTLVTANVGGGFSTQVGTARTNINATGWVSGATPFAAPSATIFLISTGNAPLGVGSSLITLDAGSITATTGLAERSRSTRMGDWQPYTPAWTASVTNPTIGNGTLTGRYMVVGTTCFFELTWIAGSTTTFGSGTWSFSLPQTASASAVLTGAVKMRPAATNFRVGVTDLRSTTTFGILYDTSVNFLTSTTPATWVSSDDILVCGFYEIQ